MAPRRSLVGWTLTVLLATCSGTSAAEWERLDRLADIRLDASVDLTARMREKPVTLELPFPATIAGQRTKSVVVGAGWIAATEEGPRLSILSGDGVGLG